jgi:hypothetical protein
MSVYIKRPGCFACDQPELPMPASNVGKDDDIALCTYHWNWWLIRWFLSDDPGEPPCSAHWMGKPE